MHWHACCFSRRHHFETTRQPAWSGDFRVIDMECATYGNARSGQAGHAPDLFWFKLHDRLFFKQDDRLQIRKNHCRISKAGLIAVFRLPPPRVANTRDQHLARGKICLKGIFLSIQNPHGNRALEKEPCCVRLSDFQKNT